MVFVDPPYDLPSEYAATLGILGGKPGIAGGKKPQLVIAQHDRRTILSSEFGFLHRVREIRQGDNVLSFYRSTPE